jgi:hypothetical protein
MQLKNYKKKPPRVASQVETHPKKVKTYYLWLQVDMEIKLPP